MSTEHANGAKGVIAKAISGSKEPSDSWYAVAAEVLEELAIGRCIIVELPEPDDDHRDGIAFWWQSAEVGASDGMVITRLDPGSESIWLNPEVARNVAAALLAAADAAEQSTAVDR